ncbi:hypothetical protein LY76DRAFT_221329 [Colletotrichum caudatum]|nr:hypothetical protein LY76DRAFT_221329 [Colletotrichum caudatum]
MSETTFIRLQAVRRRVERVLAGALPFIPTLNPRFLFYFSFFAFPFGTWHEHPATSRAAGIASGGHPNRPKTQPPRIQQTSGNKKERSAATADDDARVPIFPHRLGNPGRGGPHTPLCFAQPRRIRCSAHSRPLWWWFLFTHRLARRIAGASHRIHPRPGRIARRNTSLSHRWRTRRRTFQAPRSVCSRRESLSIHYLHPTRNSSTVLDRIVASYRIAAFDPFLVWLTDRP